MGTQRVSLLAEQASNAQKLMPSHSLHARHDEVCSSSQVPVGQPGTHWPSCRAVPSGHVKQSDAAGPLQVAQLLSQLTQLLEASEYLPASHSLSQVTPSAVTVLVKEAGQVTQSLESVPLQVAHVTSQGWQDGGTTESLLHTPCRNSLAAQSA
eukprot:TRINITY_DN9823_c0_g1_i2.p3 TRINITY_DN9823_c0_g1~~TRINITY_DN9823_c0_g1_i2.p3  ORF type:complete len:153 (-),score=23.07 TRINITY_DN9823_c0_g1_i2:254-712(-)